MRKTKDPSAESKINGPFVHNLPKRKPAKRKVFTFRGIQSTHGLLITLKRRKCTIICIQMYRPILVLYLSLSCGPKKLYMYSFWGNPDFITENWESTRQSATDYKSCQAEGRDHWTKAKEDKACAWATYALGRAWEEGIENWSKVEIRSCGSKTLS